MVDGSSWIPSFVCASLERVFSTIMSVFHAAAFQRPVSRLEGAFIMVDCRVVALHCR